MNTPPKLSWMVFVKKCFISFYLFKRSPPRDAPSISTTRTGAGPAGVARLRVLRSLHPAAAPARVRLQHHVADHPSRVHVAVRAALYAGGLAAAEATPGLRYALGEALLPHRLNTRAAKEWGRGKREKGVVRKKEREVRVVCFFLSSLFVRAQFVPSFAENGRMGEENK